MFHRSYLIQSLKTTFPGYASSIDAYPSLIGGLSVKKVLKTQGPVITPLNQYRPRKDESNKYFYMTRVSIEEVAEIAAKHNRILEEGTDVKMEDRLTTQRLLPVQVKKKKNTRRTESVSEEPQPKRTRSSTPQKKSGNTSSVNKTSEVAGKSIVVEEMNPEHFEPAAQAEVDAEVSQKASASGPAAPEVVRKSRTNPKRKRKKKLLILESDENAERDAAIAEVEMYKTWEETSWESGIEADQNEFLDAPIPKDELAQKLANQGIYRKINFNGIPDFVINGPKLAKFATNIPYTVPVQNSFSKIFKDLTPQPNCIEEVSVSASVETPAVSIKPSSDPLKQLSEHVLFTIPEADVSTPTSVENVEVIATEVNAEVATSEAILQEITPVVHVPNPVSQSSIDSEKTLSDHQASQIETLVEAGTSSKALQLLELELHKPSPQKSQPPQLTTFENDYLNTFAEVITPPTEQTKTPEPSNILDKPSSSSVLTTLQAITQEDVQRVLMGINDKVKDIHKDLPALSFAPDQMDGECSAIATICTQMMHDLSSQYRRSYIMTLARHKFTEYKAAEYRIRRAKRLHEEKMNLVTNRAVDQFSTFFEQELEKIVKVDSESEFVVDKMGIEVVLQKMKSISEEALKKLQDKLLNPSLTSQP
jgi:hypothetical protein